MRPDYHARGGVTVGVLSRMEPWEANLILNLRLWCEGPLGQEQVWSEYRKALPAPSAKQECKAFEMLVSKLVETANRPLVRHDVNCSCVGSDECIFVNLVKTASDGHLADAALIGTLLTRPAHAELIALLAGQVGECTRRMHKSKSELRPQTTPNVVRLH